MDSDSDYEGGAISDEEYEGGKYRNKKGKGSVKSSQRGYKMSMSRRGVPKNLQESMWMLDEKINKIYKTMNSLLKDSGNDYKVYPRNKKGQLIKGRKQTQLFVGPPLKGKKDKKPRKKSAFDTFRSKNKKKKSETLPEYSKRLSKAWAKSPQNPKNKKTKK